MTALFLLRHAHAGDSTRWTGDDDLRPLSDKGIRQAERLGRLLATLDERPRVFVTSPRLRALQTAEHAASASGAPVVVDPRVAGPLDLDALAGILDDVGSDGACLVGHDPDFSDLLGDLLGTDPVPMRKGAIARVDLPDRRPRRADGTLRFLLPPEVVPGR